MMNKHELKKYLEEQLSNEEKNKLEQTYSDNPFLDEALDGLTEWKENKTISFDNLQQELDDKIDKVRNEQTTIVTKKKSILRMPIFRVIAVAAAIVGILFFSVNFLFEKRKHSEKIYASYFKVLTHPDGVVRSDEASNDNNYTSQAIQYYEQENYKKAIEYYNKALEQNPNNEKNILFLGVSYLANFQPEKAIEVLKDATTTDNNYLDDRNWYLAMAYLKIKDLDNARVYFKKLSNTKSYYTENAKEIIESLGEDEYSAQK